jgi:hypothetical protein
MLHRGVQMTEPTSKDDQGIRRSVFLIAIILSIVAGAALAGLEFMLAQHLDAWQDVVRDHFAAIIGLPSAVFIAFVLVVFLRQTDGPIEFEGLGFRFKGASGQVVMWAVCFLTMAIAIKLCW